HPTPREIVLVHDEPWEGSGSGFYSIFKDGEKYRMYYKAWQHTASKDGSTVHPSYCAYAESTDGINWHKPNLGVVEFNGTKNNNIVLTSGKISGFNLHAGLPAVFKDSNPGVPNDERYKAIIVSVAPGKSNHGLV